MREGRWKGRRCKRRRREREKRKWERRPAETGRSRAGERTEEGRCFSPMRLGVLWGRDWSSRSDQVSLRVGFLPPLSDYGPHRAKAGPLPSDSGLPKAGTMLTTSWRGPPRIEEHTPPIAKTLQDKGPAGGALPTLGAQTSTCLTPLLSSPLLPTPGFTDTFNMDTRRPQVIPGSREAFFGYTVQQHDIDGKKW